MILSACLLFLCGCLSYLHRIDTDQYVGASAAHTGNARDTGMATSQPATQPACAPGEQVTPDGPSFILHYQGKTFEAVRGTDGRIYIIREVRIEEPKP